MSHLHPDPVKTLDTLRHRLHTLTVSLQALQHQLHTPAPLPPWQELQSLQFRVTAALNDVVSTINSNAQFLSQAHVYPLPTLPIAGAQGSQPVQVEAMVGELLRKKADARAEDWIESGIKSSMPSEPALQVVDKDFEDLWDWAGPAESEIAQRVLLGIGVDDGDDEDEDEDEDEEMEDVVTDGQGLERGKSKAEGQMMPLEDILRFMYTGVIKQKPGVTGAFMQR